MTTGWFSPYWSMKVLICALVARGPMIARASDGPVAIRFCRMNAISVTPSSTKTI